jgi:hypothetical protein
MTALKREVMIHLISLLLFFFFVSLARGWVNIKFYPFWIGGLIGTVLPDIDHIIYVYLMRPYELTSQRLNTTFQKREFFNFFELLAITSSERKDLIFHTAQFQILFLIFTFWAIFSSISLVGRGIVLGFTLHLLTDQFVDLTTDSFNNWTQKIQITLDKNKATLYWAGIFIITFALAIFF